MLEMTFAQRTPVLEAEHAIDDTNSLMAFQCLVPMLKEHRRFKLAADSTFSVSDFKAKQKVVQLEYDIN